MNWKLLVFDVLAIAWVSITAYIWAEQDNHERFRDVVLGVCIVFWRIDAHYTFYKNKRRLY